MLNCGGFILLIFLIILNSLNIPPLGQVDLGVTVLLFLFKREEKCWETPFITEISEKTTPPLLNVVIEEISCDMMQI